MSAAIHRSLVFRVLLSLWAGLPCGVQAADAPAPVESFYRWADIGSAELSPSGQRLAVTRVLPDGRRGLAVIDLKNPKASRVVAAEAQADVFEFQWVNEDWLVFDLVDLRGGVNRRPLGYALFSVKADGSERRQLVNLPQFVYERRIGREPLSWNHRLMMVPRDGSDEVVVGRIDYDNDRHAIAVFPMRLDVNTGRTRSLALGAPERAVDWIFDPNGEPRVVTSVREGRFVRYWRGPGEEKWREFATGTTLAPAFVPRLVDAGGQLYVTTQDGPEGIAVLKRFDFKAGAPEPEPIVSTPGFDFQGRFVWERQAGSTRPLGLHLLTDAHSTVWFDEGLKKIQAAADARLPGRVNRLQCRRCTSADRVVLVNSWSDREPGEYWLYESATERWQFIGRARDDVDPRRMATLDLHRVKTRDGLEIPVWVTLPAGFDKKSPRPAVVLVHGGPWVRGNTWTWDADAQFLASRGYVVIEPEFRGSLGYGERLFRAGWKQWGRAMQDDVADATRWAVDQGWVDKSRVCIAGASYGGYATLMGLARHGDLYRCGIAWVAVTDPRLMFELRGLSDIPDEAKKHELRDLIGDPQTDAKMLAEVAPVELASKITRPLLLAMGEDDVRVPLTHGTRMRAALKAAGNDPEWVVYAKEGHGWFDPKNRYDWARRMEAFLAKHLK
jgi:dipeptidyl aminopeptidase/acylaminoacyl peptidase